MGEVAVIRKEKFEKSRQWASESTKLFLLEFLLHRKMVDVTKFKDSFVLRNQREDDLRENHPFFDTPLFAVPRESKFRKICQLIVYARYDARLKDPLTGKERKVQYKSLQ